MELAIAGFPKSCGVTSCGRVTAVLEWTPGIWDPFPQSRSRRSDDFVMLEVPIIYCQAVRVLSDKRKQCIALQSPWSREPADSIRRSVAFFSIRKSLRFRPKYTQGPGIRNAQGESESLGSLSSATITLHERFNTSATQGIGEQASQNDINRMLMELHLTYRSPSSRCFGGSAKRCWRRMSLYKRFTVDLVRLDAMILRFTAGRKGLRKQQGSRRRGCLTSPA